MEHMLYTPSQRKEVQTMTDAARKARNAYKRAWYQKNPGKRREYADRYWERQAQKADYSPQKPPGTAENGEVV